MTRSDPNLPDRLVSVLRGYKDQAQVIPIVGDASTRRYFRASYGNGHSAVFMVYPDPKKSEETTFLDVQRFLEKLGLPVPRVLGIYPDQGVIILEDLGDDLLESVVNREDTAVIRGLYRDAVELLVRLRKATDGMRSGCGAFSLAFDEEKLMQEMEFFLTHFVCGLCGTQPGAVALGALHEFFISMCTTLAREPRIFAHRDYHSRNLILHRDRLVMIDFQDARMGPAQYDLASLLRDSYISLPEGVVEELLSWYFQEAEHGSQTSEERFRSVFDLMCLQRNIKALGTFGYQASVRGSSRYLSSIPRTGEYIARNIALQHEYAAFRPVVEDLISGPARSLRGSLHP